MRRITVPTIVAGLMLLAACSANDGTNPISAVPGDEVPVSVSPKKTPTPSPRKPLAAYPTPEQLKQVVKHLKGDSYPGTNASLYKAIEKAGVKRPDDEVRRGSSYNNKSWQRTLIWFTQYDWDVEAFIVFEKRNEFDRRGRIIRVHTDVVSSRYVVAGKLFPTFLQYQKVLKALKGRVVTESLITSEFKKLGVRTRDSVTTNDTGTNRTGTFYHMEWSEGTEYKVVVSIWGPKTKPLIKHLFWPWSNRGNHGHVRHF